MHQHDHGHEGAHANGHGCGPGYAPDRNGRAFALALGLNLAFVGIEAFYGWRVGSLALLADAGHNLGDAAGLLLAWVAYAAARLRPDDRHMIALVLAAAATALRALGIGHTTLQVESAACGWGCGADLSPLTESGAPGCRRGQPGRQHR
ncbi:MAG: cation transporter [Tepidimonas sp.]|uniref:cation transporter n=1 Tax=Tepidimonas sp. TaxID=2002775 RepID=UPI0040552D14